VFEHNDPRYDAAGDRAYQLKYFCANEPYILNIKRWNIRIDFDDKYFAPLSIINVTREDCVKAGYANGW
jgi:hypothetical protein